MRVTADAAPIWARGRASSAAHSSPAHSSWTVEHIALGGGPPAAPSPCLGHPGAPCRQLAPTYVTADWCSKLLTSLWDVPAVSAAKQETPSLKRRTAGVPGRRRENHRPRRRRRRQRRLRPYGSSNPLLVGISSRLVYNPSGKPKGRCRRKMIAWAGWVRDSRTAHTSGQCASAGCHQLRLLVTSVVDSASRNN